MKESLLDILGKQYEARIKELEEEIERQSKAQIILDNEITEANHKISKAIEKIEWTKYIDVDTLHKWLKYCNDLMDILQNGSDN